MGSSWNTLTGRYTGGDLPPFFGPAGEFVSSRPRGLIISNIEYIKTVG
jgi:hypothetical protein